MDRDPGAGQVEPDNPAPLVILKPAAPAASTSAAAAVPSSVGSALTGASAPAASAPVVCYARRLHARLRQRLRALVDLGRRGHVAGHRLGVGSRPGAAFRERTMRRSLPARRGIGLTAAVPHVQAGAEVPFSWSPR